MNSQLSLRLRFAGVVGLAGLLTIPAQAVRLSLVPAVQVADVGDPVEIRILIAGLGNFTAPSLGAFDVSVSFNPAVLSYDSATFGDPVLGDLLAPLTGSITGLTDLAPGLINLFEVSLDAPSDLHDAQPDNFLLASLRFSMTAQGSTTVSLQDVLLADAWGAPLPVESIENATVSAIPETGTFAVGAATLAAGIATALRRRRNHQPAATR